MQDIESDTGYDTRRRAPDGVLARLSQTAVYDTCGSATPASQRRTAPSRWLDSCVRALRTGDVLVVWKLNRLGRTLDVCKT